MTFQLKEEFLENHYWRKCGSCKKEIEFSRTYQVCGVTACQKHAYCSIDCWSLHNSIMNHKSGWCEDRLSPKKEAVTFNENGQREQPRRVIVNSSTSISSSSASKNTLQEEDILIVVSKLKQYIKDKHDMNTSGSVMEILSHQVRRIVDGAAERARQEGRKTVMERDF